MVLSRGVGYAKAASFRCPAFSAEEAGERGPGHSHVATPAGRPHEGDLHL